MEIIPHLERIFPLLLLGLGGYVTYAYCYEFCWQTVDGNGRSGGLMAGFLVLGLLLLICWTQVLLIGPGEADPVTVDEERPPEVFLCDPQGYRQWCSTCQRIKPDRAHHSGQMRRCVPKMDHYCAWMFAVVGLRNLKFFIQFLFYVCVLCIYIIVTLAAYAHDRAHISRQIASLYGLTGFFLILVGVFTAFHFRYVLINQTTIEHMNVGSDNLPIYNICLEDGVSRVVTRLYMDDVNKIGPYNNGWINNWKTAMGNYVWDWLLPIPQRHFTNLKTNVSYDTFNPNLLSILRKRFATGKEGYLAFNQPKTHSSQQNN